MMTEKYAIANYPTKLEDYAEKYKEWIKFTRKDHILEMRLHTNDGPMEWNCDAQAAINAVCHDINNDPENEVLIITGTGDSFIGKSMAFDDPRAKASWPSDWRTPWSVVDCWYHNQSREAMALAYIQIPVISAINGAAFVHPEVALFSDINICSEDTMFGEAHFSAAQVVPGDGTWAIWRTLIGLNRARYMMYMGKLIDAKEALNLGVVNEVLPKDKLMDRAWEIAYKLMETPRYCRRLTRSFTSHQWKRMVLEEMENGLAHEGLAALCDNLEVWAENQVERNGQNTMKVFKGLGKE
ncbi:MAG: enoyl-CoA hydratase/isomerase family protein [Firmicutes bacterium]|nr:enoyl-CoA hydratase/isomerase family protein [Bacillota bacterium]